MRKFSSLITLITLPIITNTQTISCPSVSCDAPLDGNACYEHDTQQPVVIIRGYSCETYQLLDAGSGPDQVCDFSLSYSAWFDERYQYLTKGTNQSQSAINRKKTVGYCRDVVSVYQNLNNGRACQDSSQCNSKRCVGGICTGLDNNANCHSHGDCNTGYFCNKALLWPYPSTCTKLKTSYEQCTEDEECGIANYCWYASAEDRTTVPPVRKCLPLYSQEDGASFGWSSAGLTLSSSFRQISYEDYERNGKYCKSGFAFPVIKGSPTQKASIYQANCTSVDTIQYKGTILNSASFWPCDPTQQDIKCFLNFNSTFPDPAAQSKTYENFTVGCGCAMDGFNGYCSKILGTNEYRDAMGLLKEVLENSECHTLDRYDMRAQRDSCGIRDKGALDKAINSLFNINHWPLVHGQDSTSCIKTFFDDSYENLSKLDAMKLLRGLQLLSGSLSTNTSSNQFGSNSNQNQFQQLPQQQTLNQSRATSGPKELINNIQFNSTAQGQFNDIVVNDTGDYMVSCSADKKFIVWKKEYSTIDTDQYSWQILSTQPDIYESNDQSSMIGGDVNMLDSQTPSQTSSKQNSKSEIWKCEWADQVFGTVLAFSDMNKKVQIWEYNDDDQIWDKQMDQNFKDSIQDIKFAPNSNGLLLAVGCFDGNIYIYNGSIEGEWTKKNVVLTNTFGISSIDWNQSQDEPPMLIVASASHTLNNSLLFDQSQQKDLIKDTQLQIFQYDDNKDDYNLYATLRDPKLGDSNICSVAWAPLAGRNHHLIATGSQSGLITVWRVETRGPFSQGELNYVSDNELVWQTQNSQMVTVVAQTGSKSSKEVPVPIIELKWSAFGSHFLSSGRDGIIKVWKQNINNQFKEVARFSVRT
ncbi:transducin family protein wd-40 repeat family protein [Stylonychia lemnae]|uniref:Transducin family protein wd-40 repeat family protein n=1 Tax=Stylonychia lemnae TaxID=5949 RepID=A0A078AR82_STYLE|nr:transducin family protein wd-40 repeat family protein [Stylonychia lemnae]|eukprot:CDW84930.1 transducin family protein wd-40 repeat family protein [Stylonychia lemnae]